MDSWTAITDFLAFDPARAAEPDILVRCAIQGLLLCASAFFSGSETAMFSLSHVDLQVLRQRRHPQATKLQALLDEPRRLIVSILCGNELVNIASVANMTGILVALYGEEKAGILAVLVMVPLLLLFGEVTPKTIAVSNPRRISAGLLARPLSRWVSLVAPLRWVVRQASERITTWIVGAQRDSEHLLQIDEFRSLIDDVAESGDLDVTGRTLINNLLSAGATEVVEIMTPRSRIDFLDADLGTEEVLRRFRAARHSRAPVYRDQRDNLVGFLHIEDVLRIHQDGADLSAQALEEILRPPVVVPLTKTVDEMFDYFTTNQVSAAAALNEFGGVAGMVTVTDVLRFIFGPLTQRSEVETRVREVQPGVFEMPGDTKLAEMRRVAHLAIDDPRMTTIGGVAFRHIDRLPKAGDRVEVEGLEITVLEMDAHRIAAVRVVRNGHPRETQEVPPES